MKCSVKRIIKPVMGVEGFQHNFYKVKFLCTQVSDSTTDADILELSAVSAGETTPLSGNSPSEQLTAILQWCHIDCPDITYQ